MFDNVPVSAGGRGDDADTRAHGRPAREHPGGPRFVDDALTSWGRADLVDDVALSVTELATNATCTAGARSSTSSWSVARDPVRVAVVDAGGMPARSIAARGGPRSPPTTRPTSTTSTSGSMTGRGLFIVSALASSWGIDDLPGGTRVWADFGGDQDQTVAGPPVLDGAATEPAPVTGAPSPVIRLLGCPPDLLFAHDDNLADIARELSLFGASHADPRRSGPPSRSSRSCGCRRCRWGAARLVARQALHEAPPESTWPSP